MLKHPTIDKLLTRSRLSGMASALTQQQNNPDIEALGFEERLGLLVEREASDANPGRHHRACAVPN